MSESNASGGKPVSASGDSSNTGRWWEYYAVRYSMGTAVGFLLMRTLCARYHTDLSLLGVNGAPSASPTDAIFWLFLGLTYCYVASAPVLTIHTARNLLTRQMLSSKAFFCTLLFPSVAAYLGMAVAHKSGHPPIWWTIATALLITIGSIQFFLLFHVITKMDTFYEFYKRLTKNRSANASRSAVQARELVESYRHLREHGNSFFIVLCEIILAVILWLSYQQGPDSQSVNQIWVSIVAVIWITPAGLVWLVSTLFERLFASDGSLQTL